MESENLPVGMYAQRVSGLDGHAFAGDEMDAGLAHVFAEEGERQDREDPGLGETFSDAECKVVAARVGIRCEPEAATLIREVHRGCKKRARVDEFLPVVQCQLHRAEPGGEELLQGGARVDELAKAEPVQHILHAGAVSTIADRCVESDAGADTERTFLSRRGYRLSDFDPA